MSRQIKPSISIHQILRNEFQITFFVVFCLAFGKLDLEPAMSYGACALQMNRKVGTDMQKFIPFQEAVQGNRI